MKTMVGIAVVVVALCCVVPAAHCSRAIVYPKDCNQTGTGLTLNEVLNGRALSDTLYQLQTGTHCITNFSYVQDLRNLTFSGNSSHPESVRVTCAKKVGLGFVNISALRLEGMTVTGCGLTGGNFEEFQRRMRNSTDFFYHLHTTDVIAMLVGLVSNFTLSNFAINGTEGLGLLAVNLQQSTLVESSNFSNNHPLSCYRLPLNNKTGVNITENDQTGGGAFFVYNNFVGPSEHMPKTLDIHDSTFLANSYCGLEAAIELDYRFSEEVHERGYSLGAGGGLSVVLAQTAYGMDIVVESSLFRNNTSKFGGGAHIALFAGVCNNTIAFYNCDFLKNGLAGSIVQALEYSTSGSALYVVKDIAHPTVGHPFFIITNATCTNDVLLQNCSLVGNRASVAGAVNIYSLYSSRVKYTITFDNCTISGNEALVGAAFYIGEQKQSGVQPGINIIFRDVKLTRNRILFESIGNIATSKSDSSAAIEAQAVNITIEGNNSLLSDNYATAIRAVSSVIYISDHVVLCNNSGLFGGAMHLVSSSFLVLRNNSHARFENNTGAVEGGAFYINLYTYAPDLYYQDCFLYFGDLDVLCFGPGTCSNVENLNFTLELIYNKSPLGSLIFGSTLDTCPWSLVLKERYGDLSSKVLDIMFYNLTDKFNFSSSPTTVNAVTTPSNKLVIHDLKPLSVTPGELFYLNVTGYDRFNRSTPVLLSSKPSDDLQNISSSLGTSNFSFLNGGDKDSVPVIVTGRQNVTDVDVYLYATDSYAQAKFQVNLTECAALVAFVYQDGRCQCEPGIPSDIECNSTSMTLMVPNNHWAGPGPNGRLMVAKCISDYCSLGEREVKPPNFDSQCHPNYRRSGILCGACEEGYSVTLGSHRCKHCNNNSLALILLFAVSGIIIVFGISFLRITVSDGYLNTILFYSNILSIYIPILDEGSRLAIVFVIVAWFNLSYGIEQCFYSGMTALSHTSLQLVFPAYLFLLMLGIMILAKKSGPLSRLFSSAKFSAAKLFATLILMSYATVLQTCLKILGAVRVHTLDGEGFSLWRTDPHQNYFQDSHIIMAVISVLLLVFIILPVPILLMFPALTFSTRLGVKIKPILDAFWAPFRTKFRFFVGLRLLLRVFPSVLANQVSRPLNVILLGIFSISVLFLQVLAWPFEGFLRNAFDLFFISNIIVLVMGTLYFEIGITAHQEHQGFVPYHRAQYAYFTIFIAMAYVAFLLIIVWHIVQRFTSIRKTLQFLVLKVRRQKTNKMTTDPRVSETTPILHIQGDSDGSSYSEDNPGPPFDSQELTDANVRTASHRKTQPDEHKPTVVNYSILREPLLEEGVAEMVPAAVTN